ncbi:MAG: hypothetical protein CMO12_01935 [Thaumarchaeota archaeon]|nr:hypothetical protein [Nitrososphaerota archaeon]
MFEAVLLGRSPECWIKDLSTKYSATVDLIDIKPLEGEDGVQELFEINVQPDLADSLLDDLNQARLTEGLEFTRPSEGRIYGSFTVRCGQSCKAFIESRSFLTSARCRPDCTVEWTVRGAGYAYKDLMERLDRDDLDLELRSISTLKVDNPLTARQTTLLIIAIERGFFDFPRGISLRQLARETGVSTASLSETLRRAQRNALNEYLRGKIRPRKKLART